MAARRPRKHRKAARETAQKALLAAAASELLEATINQDSQEGALCGSIHCPHCRGYISSDENATPFQRPFSQSSEEEDEKSSGNKGPFQRAIESASVAHGVPKEARYFDAHQWFTLVFAKGLEDGGKLKKKPVGLDAALLNLQCRNLGFARFLLPYARWNAEHPEPIDEDEDENELVWESILECITQ